MRIATFILGVVFALFMLIALLPFVGLLGIFRATPADPITEQTTIAFIVATLCAVVGMAFTLEMPAVATAVYIIGVVSAFIASRQGPPLLIFSAVSMVVLAALSLICFVQRRITES